MGRGRRGLRCHREYTDQSLLCAYVNPTHAHGH
jgi:hypothetical protein